MKAACKLKCFFVLLIAYFIIFVLFCSFLFFFAVSCLCVLSVIGRIKLYISIHFIKMLAMSYGSCKGLFRYGKNTKSQIALDEYLSYFWWNYASWILFAKTIKVQPLPLRRTFKIPKSNKRRIWPTRNLLLIPASVKI